MTPRNQWRYGMLAAGGMAVVSFLLPFHALAATLSLSPSAKTVAVGQTFTAVVKVSSADQPMNAVSADISFPADVVHVLSVSRTNSVINFWVQNPSFSNAESGGNIDLQGVVLSPGFTGTGGDVVDVVFQAVAAGTAKISFSSGSVLANDGIGTNILTSMSGASFTVASVAAPTITPASNATPTTSTPTKKPVQQPSAAISGITVTSDPATVEDGWYSLNSIKFNWNIPIGADGVWYAFATDPSAAPSVATVANQTTSISYNLSSTNDGVWYFMISSETNGIWSPVITKELRLDRIPPQPFTITRTDSDPADTLITFTWSTTDALSGLAHYEIKIGDGGWFDPEGLRQGSSYVISQSAVGTKTLAVRAIDNAGNIQEEDTTFHVVAPNGWQEWWYQVTRFSLFSVFALVILIILFVILYYLLVWNLLAWKRKAKKELREFQKELREEIGRIEGEKGKGKTANTSLRPSSLAKEIERLRDETEAKVEEIEKLK